MTIFDFMDKHPILTFLLFAALVVGVMHVAEQIAVAVASWGKK